MSCFGIFLLLTTVNQVLCLHDSLGNPFTSLSSTETPRYCNDWAVEIHGGSEMADHIATKFGFINMGQV